MYFIKLFSDNHFVKSIKLYLKKMPPKAPARPAASTAKTTASTAASTAKTAAPAAGITFDAFIRFVT